MIGSRGEDGADSVAEFGDLGEEKRAWSGGLWVERVTSSALAGRGLDLHLATRDDLTDLAEDR